MLKTLKNIQGTFLATTKTIPVLANKILDKTHNYIGYTVLVILLGAMLTNGFNFSKPKTALATEPQISSKAVQESELTPEEEIASGSVVGNDVVEVVEKTKYSNWDKEIALAKTRDKITQEQVKIMQDNKDFYGQDKDCHWILMASVHYRENKLSFDMPKNNQGLFGNSKGGAGSDKNVQLKKACQDLKQKSNWADLSKIDDKDLICDTLAKYNGTRKGLDCYDKAYNTSFLYQNTGKTQCAVDGCASTSTDRNAGALLVIAKLLINN